MSASIAPISNQSILFVGNYLSHNVSSRAVSEDISRRLEGQGIAVCRTSSQVNKAARLCDMMTTTWRKRHQYQIAHVDVYSGQAFFFAEIVGRLLKQLGKPFVLTLHGGHLPEFALSRMRRVARLLQSADAVTSPSRYLQEKMQPYRTDIRLLPNPIDLSRLTSRHRDSVQPRLMWLRAFHEMYQPTLAVDVLHRLLPKFPEATLLMVGPDKGDGSMAQTQNRTQELGLAGRITITGGVPKDEIGQWLDRGDIFLNTTTVDNTPVSVIEAMASGLCMVSTNVGGLPYLLEQNHTALLVPPRNVEAMAAAVECLLENPETARRLSMQAYETARTFDWNVILPQWQHLFHNLAVEQKT